MIRQPYNLFRVSDETYDAINAWVTQNATAPESEKMKPGQFPDAFCENWRIAAQAAFARLFSETPYIVVFGGLAVCALPVLIALALLL